MTKEQLLKDIIIQKYGNLKRFADQTGIPYMTIRNIIQRGIDRASVTTMIQITRILEIDLDALMENQLSIKPNPQKEAVWRGFVNAMNSGNFTQDDMIILEHAQKLTPDQKKSLLALLESMSVKPPQEDASALPESEEESP